jgi:hypothetical protein
MPNTYFWIISLRLADRAAIISHIWAIRQPSIHMRGHENVELSDASQNPELDIILKPLYAVNEPDLGLFTNASYKSTGVRTVPNTKRYQR